RRPLTTVKSLASRSYYFKDLIDHAVERHLGCVNKDGIGSFHQWGSCAFGVPAISFFEFNSYLLDRNIAPTLAFFFAASACAHFKRRVEEYLYERVRKDFRSDVAAVHHHAAFE